MTSTMALRRVLLVDDEPVTLGAVRRVIERARPDAVVVYASDVATAEWQIRSTSVGLVITDLRMQSDEQAGFKVVELARSAGIPVAVMTGADPSALDAVRALGVPVIVKGARIASDLVAMVELAFPQT